MVEQSGRVFDGQQLQKGAGKATVAIVPITGEITSGDSSPSSGTTGSEDTIALLEAIRRSDDYDGVILEVNSPGGGVLASSEIADEIRRVRGDGIKVVAWMREMAASGGYYVSAGADRIVASPETITGSIGVILKMYDATGLAKKVGVTEVNITSGALKDMGTPFKKLSPEARAVLQQLVDESYSGFVNVVSTGRDIPDAEVRKLADGRIYTGTQARELHLVDSLGLRDEAYSQMAKLVGAERGSRLEVVEFSRQVDFFDALGAATKHWSPGAIAQLIGARIAGSGGTIPGSSSSGVDALANPGFRLEYRMVVQ